VDWAGSGGAARGAGGATADRAAARAGRRVCAAAGGGAGVAYTALPQRRSISDRGAEHGAGRRGFEPAQEAAGTQCQAALPDAYCIGCNWRTAGCWEWRESCLQGRDPGDVEKVFGQAIADVRDHGISGEDLDKAKTILRNGEIKQRETCTDLATLLGDEALIGGDPARVNLEADASRRDG